MNGKLPLGWWVERNFKYLLPLVLIRLNSTLSFQKEFHISQNGRFGRISINLPEILVIHQITKCISNSNQSQRTNLSWTGRFSCPWKKLALLQRVATLAKTIYPGSLKSKLENSCDSELFNFENWCTTELNSTKLVRQTWIFKLLGYWISEMHLIKINIWLDR